MRISIIYDLPEENESDERELSAVNDTVQTAQEIAQAISADLVPLSHNNYLQALKSLNCDLIFNLVEEDNLGYLVLEEIEHLGKKVTGVGSAGYKLSWRKDKIKKLLVENNIPTPKYFIVKYKDKLTSVPINFPLFVKAADDHGSLSINQKSYVTNLEELEAQVDWVKKEIGGDVLVEEYIDGKELALAILGNEILPPREIIVKGPLTYDIKWKKELASTCPAVLTAIQLNNITKAIKKTCEVLEARDYARFDIRLKGDIPYIIDYNANPWLGSYDPFCLPYKKIGLTYPAFIQKIVDTALKRYS